MALQPSLGRDIGSNRERDSRGGGRGAGGRTVGGQ